MLKILGYVFLGLLVVISIGATVIVSKFNNRFFKERPNDLAYSYDEETIRFQWGRQQYDDHLEPHAALIIPVMIEGIPRAFYVQFDTGAPNSTIYGKPLASLIEHGVTCKEEGEQGARMVKNIRLSLGGSKVDISSMQILENYGKPIDWQDTTKVVSLGTIGSDFIEGKVTVIDFKQQNIKIFEDRPDWMAALSGFKPFDFQGRRILFPAQIGGRKRQLLYDSGSSAFGLLTSKNRFKKYSDKNAEELVYDGNSWGVKWPIHHRASEAIMSIGGSDLPLRRISYIDLYGNFQRFMTPFTKLGGFLGNKPFLEYTLILDTRNEEFLVVEGGMKRPDEAP